MRKKPKIIVIVGPNASGKSNYGVKLAKKNNGEIISADSRQVYRGLDIGSGKVSGKWKVISDKKNLITQHSKLFTYKKIPHYCIDIADPKKVFTADDFRKCAQKAITDILLRGKTPIIVGGTGFYIDAALGRIKLGGVPPNHALRQKLEKQYQSRRKKVGTPTATSELFNYLTKLDPARAKTVEQKNPRRLIRAIEIALANHASSRKHGYFSAEKFLVLAPPRSQGFLEDHGLPHARETNDALNGFFAGFGTVSDFAKQTSEQNRAKPSEHRAGGARMSEEHALVAPSKITWLGIKRNPEELKKRIHKRLLARLPDIIREVKKLHRDGVSWKRLYDLGLEYRYASLYLRGRLSHLQLVQQLTSQSWRYAKRQMTWFKKNKEIRWIVPIFLL